MQTNFDKDGYVSIEERQRALLNILEDMDEDKSKLNNQRTALYNILEDVHEQQVELERNHKELNIVKNLTQNLSKSLDIKTVMNNIVYALFELFPKITVSYLLLTNKKSSGEYSVAIRTSYPIGNAYIEHIKQDILLFLKTAPAIENKDDFSLNKLGFEIIEAKEDTSQKEQEQDQDQKLPLSFITLPVVIPGMLTSVFNISSFEANLFKKRDIDVIHILLLTATQTIERLKILIESEHSRLADLVENMVDGVLMFDTDNRIIISNPALERIMNKSENINLNDLLEKCNDDKGKRANVEGCIEKALIHSKSSYCKDIFLNGRIFDFNLTPIRDSDGIISGGAIILHDITERKEIERMKSDFVSTVSHELRTPLTITKESLSLVLDGTLGGINSKQEDVLRMAKDNMDRLARIINNILDISKMEAKRIELSIAKVDLIHIIKNTCYSFAGRAKERNLELKFTSSHEEIFINADYDKMTQVFINLIGNALKFTEEGFIEIGASEGDTHVICTVRDTGIGIAKENMPMVFGKFQQFSKKVFKTSERGSGLGLAITKELVEMHNGKITVMSEEGKGTIFTILLPKSVTGQF